MGSSLYQQKMSPILLGAGPKYVGPLHMYVLLGMSICDVYSFQEMHENCFWQQFPNHIVRQKLKMSENLCKLHRQVDKFYSNSYLNTWCNDVKIEWTEFLDRAFRSIIPNILGEPNEIRTCLDIGCGPSIANVISGKMC